MIIVITQAVINGLHHYALGHFSPHHITLNEIKFKNII